MRELLTVIQQIVYDVMGYENLTLDTDFVRDLALNSFDLVNIVCELEKRFNIEIPIREVWTLNQVRDVIDYLVSRGIAAPEQGK